ncbi:MAG: hypothetical protein ED557_03820 [Balneola sp.]|nr:MAG: hypothetical protein ED557_03820 [Balneola sp.]
MEPGYNVEKLIAEYWNPTYEVFEKALTHIPEKHLKEILKKFEEAQQKGSGKKIPIESIKILGRLDEVHPSDLDQIWLEALDETTKPIPELIKLVQERERFVRQKGDSLYISIAKVFKSIKRATRKGALILSNAFRRALRKEEVEYSPLLRHVPLKNICKAAILDLIPQISAWRLSQLRQCATVIDELQNWVFTESEGEEEKPSFDQFIEKNIDTWQELVKEHQKELVAAFKTRSERLSRYLSIVGTIELEKEYFHDEVIEYKAEVFRRIIKEYDKEWNSLFDAIEARLLLLPELHHFENRLEDAADKLNQQLSDIFEKVLFSSHSKLSSSISEAIDTLSNFQDADQKKFSAICSEIRQEILGIVENEINSPLSELIESQKIQLLFADYVNKVTDFWKGQPTKGMFVEEMNIQSEPPTFDAQQIDWQKFVQRMLGTHIALELDNVKINPEQYVVSFIPHFNEIIQIIETNLAIIDEIEKEEKNEQDDIAREGLERSLTKVNEVGELIEESHKKLTSIVNAQNEILVDKLSEFLVNQNAGDVKWMGAQLKVKESAYDWQTKFTVYWASLLDRIDLFWRFVTKKYKQYDESVRSYLGISKSGKKSEDSTNLATFLHETDQKFEQLPFIYRKLFDFKRDIEASFFIRDQLNVEECKRVLELWKGGFPASLAIIGEKGSGRSTFFRLVKDEILADEKVYEIPMKYTVASEEEIIRELANKLSLSEVSSSKELVAKIKKNRKGSIIYVEDIQNCFLRNMNGYGAIECLLYVLSETRKEVLWVVSSSRYTWSFFNIVLNISEYFSHTISSELKEESEIESVIMNRQKASGYQLRFNADASAKKSRAYRKLLDDDEAAQEYLKNQFFSKLSKMAEGNSTVAIIYWIRSIGEITESHFFINPFNFATNRLDGLDSTALFALHAFILHDTMNALELSTILNSEERNCEMIISRLASRGILVKREGAHYVLNKLIYRQVVRQLKLKNII